MALIPTWLNTCAAPDDASLSDGAQMAGYARRGDTTDEEFVGTPKFPMQPCDPPPHRCCSDGLTPEPFYGILY